MDINVFSHRHKPVVFTVKEQGTDSDKPLMKIQQGDVEITLFLQPGDLDELLEQGNTFVVEQAMKRHPDGAEVVQ